MYMEESPETPEPEDGLEVGYYSYNTSTNLLTLNVTYDDNAPGDDSGVGDI